MNIPLAILGFLGLYSLNVQAHKAELKSFIEINSLIGRKDTLYIDLNKDVDFQFENNLQWFQDNRLALFGIKTKEGQFFMEPLFSQIESFSNGVSIVTFDNLQGAINQKGEIVIPFQYQELQSSSQNRIAFFELGKWGFFNTKGEIVIPPTFDYVGEFNQGLCLVSLNNKFGYINTSGATIIPLLYDYASDFEDGQAFVQIKNASFTIDTKGRKIAD